MVSAQYMIQKHAKFHESPCGLRCILIAPVTGEEGHLCGGGPRSGCVSAALTAHKLCLRVCESCACVCVRVCACAWSVSCVCDDSNTFVYMWVCARTEALPFVGLPKSFLANISQLSKLCGLSY